MVNVALVQSANRYLVISVGCLILLLSFIGNGLMICVFAVRNGKFRKSPCSLYFITMAVLKTVHLVHLLPYLIMSIGFGVDPTLTSLVYCKLRYYLAQATLPHISLTLECAATISQFLATSRQVSYREKNTYKVARISIFCTSLFWCLQAIPYLILYKIKTMPTTNKIVCDSFNTALHHYTTWVLRIMTVFILSCTILPLSGYLTLRNIRRFGQNSNRHQQIERQMSLVSFFCLFFLINLTCAIRFSIQMLLVQIASYVIGCIPFAIWSVYSLMTTTISKSSERMAIEGLVNTVIFLLANSTFGARYSRVYKHLDLSIL
jgi:hypothetical protein